MEEHSIIIKAVEWLGGLALFAVAGLYKMVHTVKRDLSENYMKKDDIKSHLENCTDRLLDKITATEERQGRIEAKIDTIVDVLLHTKNKYEN